LRFPPGQLKEGEGRGKCTGGGGEGEKELQNSQTFLFSWRGDIRRGEGRGGEKGNSLEKRKLVCCDFFSSRPGNAKREKGGEEKEREKKKSHRIPPPPLFSSFHSKHFGLDGRRVKESKKGEGEGGGGGFISRPGHDSFHAMPQKGKERGRGGKKGACKAIPLFPLQEKKKLKNPGTKRAEEGKGQGGKKDPHGRSTLATGERRGGRRKERPSGQSLFHFW